MEYIPTFLLDITFAVSNQLQAGLQHCKVKAHKSFVECSKLLNYLQIKKKKKKEKKKKKKEKKKKKKKKKKRKRKKKRKKKKKKG